MGNIGKQGEDLVFSHYKDQGYKLIERNYFPRFGKRIGEIDLIVKKDEELVFVEVKTRTSNRFGDFWDSVDLNKQKKLVKTAKLFLNQHPEHSELNIRFDVAGVDIDNKLKPVIILANAIEDTD